MLYTVEDIAAGQGDVHSKVVTPKGETGRIVGYGYDDFREGRPFMAFIRTDDGAIYGWPTVDPNPTREEK